MASFSVKYIFEMVDRFSGRASKLGAAAKKMGAAVRAAGSSLNATARATAAAGAAATAASRRFHMLTRSVRNLRTVQHTLMSGALMGLGGGYGARMATSTLLEYEEKMNQVRANMMDVIGGEPVIKGAKSLEESAKFLEMLRKETTRIAQVSKYTPTDVADGLLELARMGYDAQTAMKLLHPTIRMAGAAAMEAGGAVDKVTNIMTMFGGDADQAASFVDRLAMAVSNTNLTFAELYEGLKYAGPSAAGGKVGMNETVAVMMTLAKAGQKASMGGTAFARMMEYSYEKTPKAAKALKSIGMSFKDLVDPKTGKHGSMIEILTKFASASEKFGRGKVIEAIQALYKLRGGRAAKVLADFDMIDDIINNKRLLDQAKGRAELMERVMMSGIYGAYEKMRASLYELIISLGDAGLSKNITWLADKVRDVANYISNLSPETRAWIAHIATAVGLISVMLIPLGMLALAVMALAPLFTLLLSPFRLLGMLAVGFVTGLSAGLAPLGRMVQLITRFGGAAAGALFAFRALRRLIGIGLAIELVFIGLSHFEQIKEYLTGTKKFEVVFPDAPDWLKFLMRNAEWFGMGGRETARIAKDVEDYMKRSEAPTPTTGWQSKWRRANEIVNNAPKVPEFEMPSGVKGPVSAPNPNRVPQAAAEKVKIESKVNVDTTFQPATVNVTGQVDASGLIRLQGQGQIKANRGQTSPEAGTTPDYTAP